LKGRVQVINLWRPIRGPLRRSDRRADAPPRESIEVRTLVFH
jgi:hypothetical protein